MKFPVIAATDDHPDDLLAFRQPTPSMVIWTTTPWTIPANRAISYGPEIAYGLYEVEAMETGLEFEPWAKPGDRLIVADKLAEDVFKAAKIADLDARSTTSIRPAWSAPTRWPTLDAGYGFDVPLLAGDHVTDDAGTGFVHTAPGHGADDYRGLEGPRSSRDPRHRRSRRRLLSRTCPVRAASRCWRPRARRPASSARPTARSWTS